jgi:hypothetical protein
MADETPKSPEGAAPQGAHASTEAAGHGGYILGGRGGTHAPVL